MLVQMIAKPRTVHFTVPAVEGIETPIFWSEPITARLSNPVLAVSAPLDSDGSLHVTILVESNTWVWQDFEPSDLPSGGEYNLEPSGEPEPLYNGGLLVVGALYSTTGTANFAFVTIKFTLVPIGLI